MRLARYYEAKKSLHEPVEESVIERLPLRIIALTAFAFLVLGWVLGVTLQEIQDGSRVMSPVLGVVFFFAALVEGALGLFLVFCFVFRFLPWREAVEARRNERYAERWQQKHQNRHA